MFKINEQDKRQICKIKLNYCNKFNSTFGCHFSCSGSGSQVTPGESCGYGCSGTGAAGKGNTCSYSCSGCGGQ